MINQYEKLKQTATAHIEYLFKYWKIDYRWINSTEIDFINPTRQDKSFGSARFNITKGIGADFANTNISSSSLRAFGQGFDASDFDISPVSNHRRGFDIIGLAQLIYNLPSYRLGAEQLVKDLTSINKDTKIKIATDADVMNKQIELLRQKQYKIAMAVKTLSYCVNIKGTKGEEYFKARGIKLNTDEEIYFHPKVMNKELNALLPCIIFPVKRQSHTELKGIHRIYLSHDCTGKAPVNEPKLLLGDKKGNAIWFGKVCQTLHICEGPENALTVLACGAQRVACAIDAGNMDSLTIPIGTREVVICPDRDKAGVAGAQRAVDAYKVKYKVSILMPKLHKLPNGKYADFNDILRLGL